MPCVGDGEASVRLQPQGGQGRVADRGGGLGEEFVGPPEQVRKRLARGHQGPEQGVQVGLQERRGHALPRHIPQHQVEGRSGGGGRDEVHMVAGDHAAGFPVVGHLPAGLDQVRGRQEGALHLPGGLQVALQAPALGFRQALQADLDQGIVGQALGADGVVADRAKAPGPHLQGADGRVHLPHQVHPPVLLPGGGEPGQVVAPGAEPLEGPRFQGRHGSCPRAASDSLRTRPIWPAW